MADTVIDSWATTNYDDEDIVGTDGNVRWGQTFNAGSGLPLTYCQFYLKKYGSPTGNLYVELYAITGTYGSTAVPTGAVLATSGNYAIASLTTSMQLITFTFATPYTLTLNTKYTICLRSPAFTTAYPILGGDPGGGHGGNKYYYDGSYHPYSNDFIFYCYNTSSATRPDERPLGINKGLAKRITTTR